MSREADKCVKCGLCLPVCPTYSLLRVEGESPRGRVALIQAVVDAGVGPDPALRAHLDHCLLCRRCEPACPSGVAYGELLDGMRALGLQRASWPRRSLSTVLRGLMTGPGLGVLIAMQRHLPALGRLGRAVRNWRMSGAALPRAGDASAGRPLVLLYVGCVSRHLDARLLDEVEWLLLLLGFRVRRSASLRCCGAIHRHAGDVAGAARLAARNRAGFAEAGAMAVISVASGCAAQLAETHPDVPVFEACDFIARHLPDAGLKPRMLRREVLLHVPCSQRYPGPGSRPLEVLLDAIPGLRWRLLDAGHGCCGAAGMQLLQQAELAGRLLQPLLDAVDAAGPDCVVSTNIGCALHLAAGLPGEVVVRHPLSLLAEALLPAREEG